VTPLRVNASSDRSEESAGGQGFSESGSRQMGASDAVVGAHQTRSDAESFRGVSLGREVFLIREHACVPDQ